MEYTVKKSPKERTLPMKDSFVQQFSQNTLVRKYHWTADQKTKLKLLLTPPTVPTFIQNLIRRE